MLDPDDQSDVPWRPSLPFVEPHEWEEEARNVRGSARKLLIGRTWGSVTRRRH
jgi:hypothetical protein